ncbi:AFL005Wp [Eremothecium gossypii ATCC 10895]|uniref:AFL005Wp n=1 Tax=Eremothecium gossypii (strain ATCC 10895 / CBS 109.51 / FGSC 9923 / NRRL Y-1056) TaxID=284811 RepID=Q754S6_EREGS|nr:AFL005Wp [Eremothecium gossypii ATCC 10895]AAS53367.1 AFL005Wp [Eremothecium gossypii ATCC 10895]AEY97678.1 FAFL005Wp [Eremothecium gossypii FDAG1]
MNLKTFLQVLVLGMLPLQVSGFYFYVNGGDRKCFHSELMKDAVLNLKYNVQSYDSQSGTYRDMRDGELMMMIDIEEVFDDNHRVMHQKLPAYGTTTFNAVDSGEHKVCVQPQFQGWMARTKTKITLDFEIGSDLLLDPKKKDKLQYLHSRVLQLGEKVKAIRNEQRLVREREAQFRDASESANSWVVWCAVMTLFVLGGTCFWQVNHLRTFFMKQKVL